MKSVDGGQTISFTVTPAGASIDSTVGINSGSRGLFDWGWRPSGRETLSATRASGPTTGVTVARGRLACARAERATQSTQRKQRTQRRTARARAFVFSVPPCVLDANVIQPASAGSRPAAGG